MSAELWSYEEMIEEIEKVSVREVLHFRVVPYKKYIEVMKLPSTDGAVHQIVMRVATNNGSGWTGEPWRLIMYMKDIHEQILNAFDEWFSENIIK